MPDTPKIIATGIPFAQLPHACTLDLNVTNAAFRVYALLMKLADSEGRAFPGHRYIATVLPMSRPTTERALENLETVGWITVDRTKQAHQYYVHGELQTLPFETGKETLPVTKLGRTGKETLPEPVTKLGPIDNHYTQPSIDNHLALSAPAMKVAQRGTFHDLSKGEYHTAMKNALVLAMGWEIVEIPKAQWGRIEAAAKMLTDIDADPTDVWFRAQVYPLNIGGTMTPNSIATNWADLKTPREPTSRRELKRVVTRAKSRAAIAALDVE